jgi:hypothetical protein
MGKMVYIFTEYPMYVWKNAISKNRKEEAEQKIINNNYKELGFNFMAPKT